MGKYKLIESKEILNYPIGTEFITTFSNVKNKKFIYLSNRVCDDGMTLINGWDNDKGRETSLFVKDCNKVLVVASD
jgi:hypothetical protein